MDNLNIEQQLKLYQNANNDAASIKANFVIRLQEFELIIEDLLRKKTNDPVQHELILGRRGSGKSTLLRRIQIEIQESPILQNKYIVINLAEEQANIYRLLDLWEEILKEIAHQTDEVIELKKYSEFKNDHSYSRYLFSEIEKLLTENKRKAVVLIDNIDRILDSSAFDDKLLRESFLNFNNLKFIGGSTRMTEHFWRYDKPFYDFFRIHRLHALSNAEMKLLLNQWSTILNCPPIIEFVKNNPGKIETIRILTDGLPRTLLIFIQLLVQKTNLEGYDYLRGIMDKVTPLYQERINNLPPAHRKIILNMAFIWESCTTKQLSEVCKMESKLISAHLKQLSDGGLVDKLGTQNKNYLYRISERFFNLWLIMTQGSPTEKRRARWLTIFLESWYSENEIMRMAEIHLKELNDIEINDTRRLAQTKALIQSKFISPFMRDELINISREKGIAKTELLPLPDKYIELKESIDKLYKEGKYESALNQCNEIEQNSDPWKFYMMGLLLSNLNKVKEAEKYYLNAINMEYWKALYPLTKIYLTNNKFNAAENLYIKVIKNKKETLKAKLGLALLYYETNKNPKKALDLVDSVLPLLSDELVWQELKIILEIWNGIFNDLHNRITIIISNNTEADWGPFIQELLVHYQTTVVKNIFEHDKLSKELLDKYLIYYYATLILSNDNDSKIKISFPPEFEEPLQSVLEYIKSMQALYYPKISKKEK